MGLLASSAPSRRWGAVGAALLLVCTAAFTWAAPAQAEDDWSIARRKDQFPNEPIYVVLPLPYSLPGIGSGIVVTAYEANYGFYHRAYALLLEGEVSGKILAVEQAALIPRHLLLDVYGLQIDKAVVNRYTFRGMNTGKNDFTLNEVNKYDEYDIRLTLSGWERRLEGWVEAFQDAGRVVRVRDPAGNLIAEFVNPYTFYETFAQLGGQVDLTDDYVDPRRGFRVNAVYQDSPRQSSSQPDYFSLTERFSAYLPIGTRSTVAFLAMQSDAFVRSKGDTDLASLNATDNLNCSASDAACQASQAALVNNALAANSNGYAQPLGGQDYLRAYPNQRFQGAHTLYYAVELRANLTEEFTPFDYFFFKGVRTGVQIAPFYESGTVSETPGTLGQLWRSDYGVGLRVSTSSGTVYRLDVANGDEGSATTIIFNYPW